MNSAVHIVTAGARTPLGLQAAPAAAALRAGITALKQHPFMVDRVGDLMPGALDAQLDPRIFGPRRLLALAQTALREACAPFSTARGPRLRLPMYLGLSEIRPGFTEQDALAVRSGIAQFEGLPVEISEVTIFTQGHAAGLAALGAATERIQQGAFEACLVGGVDSYFHPDTMEWLDANRQLAGAVSRSGFVPGEGAGFLLLMTDQVRKRLGLHTAARVLAVAMGRETGLIKTADICLGAGLTATVRDAANCLHLPAEKITDIVCDINGERYRGEEWGFVCLRVGQYFEDPTAYLSPAECWGDMGAASGPLFAMLACQACTRGYSRGPRAMLWASSEGGLRGVAVIEIVGNV